MYLFHALGRPDGSSKASSIDDSCSSQCWNEHNAGSTDPWQSHAHFGHPVAVVLPVSNGVDNLEVAFQGNCDQTELFGVSPTAAKTPDCMATQKTISTVRFLHRSYCPQ